MRKRPLEGRREHRKSDSNRSATLLSCVLRGSNWNTAQSLRTRPTFASHPTPTHRLPSGYWSRMLSTTLRKGAKLRVKGVPHRCLTLVTKTAALAHPCPVSLLRLAVAQRVHTRDTRTGRDHLPFEIPQDLPRDHTRGIQLLHSTSLNHLRHKQCLIVPVSFQTTLLSQSTLHLPPSLHLQ